MRLFSVSADTLPHAWPVVLPWIEAACARPGCDHTAASLLALLKAGQGTLWVIHPQAGEPVAAGVTQIRDYDSGRRSCWILAMGGGRVREWLPTLAAIESQSRALGCAVVEFDGRPGWSRLLPDYTAEPVETGTHYTKALGETR